MRFGSVCSGIEAASVAWHPLGWSAAWLAEIEPFPSAVLAYHYPDVPNLGDMSTLPARIQAGEVEAPDVFCGGTPCQAFSVAGLRRSLNDARGNLSLTFCEIADAIDTVRSVRGAPPAIVFWENVPGVLNTPDNAFGCFLAGLAGEDDPLEPPGGKWTNSGAVLGPVRAVAWRTLDAQYFGVAQRRRRVFVVASARTGFDPRAVLFEFDGVRRDTAPSREARQGSAAGTLRSTDGGSDVDHARAGHVQPYEVANCLTARMHKGINSTLDEGQTPVVTHSPRGEGFDASEDGTGRGTPLVPVAYTTKLHNTPSNQAGKVYEEYATSLDANSPPPAVFQPVAFDTTQVTSATNRSNPQPGDPCHPLAAGAHAPAIAFPANLSGTQHASTENLAPAMGAKNPTAVAVALRGREGGATAELGDEVQNCLRASSGGGDKPHVLAAMQVRRLTPRECERLQGFPDDYTAIPWRGKPADQCPDGPRYKALGNSWAVPVVAWIGRRIDAAARPAMEVAA